MTEASKEDWWHHCWILMNSFLHVELLAQSRGASFAIIEISTKRNSIVSGPALQCSLFKLYLSLSPLFNIHLIGWAVREARKTRFSYFRLSTWGINSALHQDPYGGEFSKYSIGIQILDSQKLTVSYTINNVFWNKLK
jgi:hypothetical protein